MAERPSVSTEPETTQQSNALPAASQFFFVPPTSGAPAPSSVREAVRVHLARQTHAEWRRHRNRDGQAEVPAHLLHVSDIVAPPRSNAPTRTPTQHTRPTKSQSHRRLPQTSASTVSVDPHDGTTDHNITASPPRELVSTPWTLDRTPLVDDVMHKFLFSYAPAVYKRAYFRGKGPDTVFLHHLCPRLIQDEMLASVIVALTSAMQGVDLLARTSSSSEAIRYFTRAIEILRERVAGGSTSDEVLWAIYLAITTCNFTHDNMQAAMHLRGLKAIVDRRRGQQASEGPASECTLRSSQLQIQYTEPQSLPLGFLNLYSSEDLSDAVTQLIGNVRAILAQRSSPLRHRLCAYLARFLINLRSSQLSSVSGQLVEVSLLAFLKWASQAGCQCHKLADGYLQSRCYRLLGADLESCDPELIDWTSSMLVATMGRGTISFDLASRLQAIRGSHRAREEIFAERFFWSEELSDRLSNFENDIADATAVLPSVQDALAALVESYTNDQCLDARSSIIDGLAAGLV